MATQTNTQTEKIDSPAFKWNEEKIKRDIIMYLEGENDPNVEKYKKEKLTIDDSDFDLDDDESYIEVELGDYIQTYENDNDTKNYLIFDEEKFLRLCVEAKKWTADREQGYAIIVMKNNEMWAEMFYSNNESHLNLSYIILTRINYWRMSDFEGFSITDSDGNEKDGYQWDQVDSEWKTNEDVDEIILDERCGAYSGQDVAFSQELDEAENNFIYFLKEGKQL